MTLDDPYGVQAWIDTLPDDDGRKLRQNAWRKSVLLGKHCDYCAGTGKVPHVPDMVTEFYHHVWCPVCGGAGKWCHWRCDRCNVVLRRGIRHAYHSECKEIMEPLP